MPNVKSSKTADDEVVVQDSVLYPSHNQGVSFDVVADHNEGDCSKLNLKGRFNLLLDVNSISLLNHGTDTKRALWNYYSIDSCGYLNYAVNFEVGTRECSTGKGKFSFLTADGAKIVNFIERQTGRSSEQNKQDNPNHSQSDASQASNVKTSSSTPTATSNPPVFPKNKLVITSSNASTRSGDATESSLGIPNADKTKSKSAPFALIPGVLGRDVPSKQKSNHLDESFRQELNYKLAVPSSPPSASDGHKKSFWSALSLDTFLFNSKSNKADKKKMKEQEKERKKKEKKEAEEMERERKAAKQRERDQKKATKKLQQENKTGKSSSSTISSSQEYSQVDDDTYSMASNIATSTQVESQSGCTYNEGLEMKGKNRKNKDDPEGDYADPWNDLFQTPASCTPNPTPPGDVYASPQKKSNTSQHKHPNISNDYEEIDLHNRVPPAIPSRTCIDGDASNEDLYAHFHNPGEMSKPTDNVYGMESASAPLLSDEAKINTVDTDVYETI